MDRTVLLIDAGYLLAAGGNLTLGTSRRNQFIVRIGGLLQALTKHVEKESKLPLLRIY
jgi:uncharacterized protein (AIM24 family)